MSETAIATTARPNVNQLIAKVGDQSLSIGARINCVGDVMRAMSHQMMAALPKHLTPDRMIRVALNQIRKNPKLLDCSAASLFGVITEAATYGWEIGGTMGHAYLVPYKDECTLIPGYKGLVDLCRRSGQISTISCEVVHQGDEFSYSLGDDPHIKHKPNDRDPARDSKPITHVYLVVRLRDGGIQRSVWSQQKIDAHKEQYSQAWRRAEQSKRRDSFWHTAWPSAAKKTVIRDMINRGLLPVSAEYRDAVNRGLQHDDDGSVIDFSTIDVMPEETPTAIEHEPETHDRPQSAEDVDSDLVTLASMNIMNAADATAVDFEADDLIRDKQPNDATVAAINGLRRDRKVALANAGKKPKQGELVK
jgi:recombination protein RecT